MSIVAPEAHSEPAAYTVAAFGAKLGVSRQFLYGLIKSGELRSLKIGGARRIPASELARLLGECS